MGKEMFTKEQLWAAEARGGTILVSAAAGSGKTTVLVERVMGMLTDPQSPVSADRLLIVTFTRASAAEMRDRLNRALAARLESEPHNLQLRRQKLLLQKASIGTIHSFCSSCLREFFAAAGIAPDFRIAETAELKIIKNEVLSELIENEYAKKDEQFNALCTLISDEKNGSTIEEMVSSIDEFITVYPDPESKLHEIAGMYDSDEAPEHSVWGRYLLDCCRDYTAYALKIIDRALDEMSYNPALAEKYAPSFENDAEQLNALLAQIDNGWDCTYHAIRSISFKQLASAPSDAWGKEAAQAARNRVKDIVKEKLPEFSMVTSEEFHSDMKRFSPAVKKLCEMALAYRRGVAARKAELHILDYDDLEHMTAHLLFRPCGEGYERTDAACEIAQRYDEILIDEYQDTNYTQDLIFRAISREEGRLIGDGTNMFMVGDIKQSIYGFRKAAPKLFLDRLNRYTPYNPDNPVFPAKITLGKNFRSRREVTDAVNFFFSQLMTVERGGVLYDSDEQKLFCGRKFPEAENRETELHILSGAAAEDNDTRDIVEARYCARLIRKMTDEGFMVTHNGEMRPAQYGDFCILRRSIGSGHGDAFVSQLTELGIPVSMSSKKGFFAAPEICVMLSLLRAVDNPLLDIPMLAALRSPIFGFDCDRIVMLRSNIKGRSLYSDILAGAAAGEEDCARAVQLLSNLRDMAAAMPSDRLISAIYRRTGYLAAVQAAENGDAKKANLLLLMDYARSFEGSGYKGLSRFLTTIDRLLEQGEDRAPAAAAAENCVTIRTMHGAKGLEFPICIIAGLGSNQNIESLKGPILTHNDFGLGLEMRDPVYRLKYHTAHRKAVKTASFSEETDEELRVLYVALTRAVDKLIMVSTTVSNHKTESFISGAADMIFRGGIEPFSLGISPSLGKWLTACALRHPDGDILRKAADLARSNIAETDVPLRVEIIDAENELLAKIADETPTERKEFASDENIIEQIRTRLDYEYPFAQLHSVPSKVTASGTHASFDSHIGDTRPSFLQEKGLSATEKGTALHKFMQFCDFELAAVSPEKESERLVREGHISAHEASSVDFEKVRKFFSGDMAALLARTAAKEREWRFTVLLESQYLSYFTETDAQDEKVILEGECDLLLTTDDGYVVVDYKTDRVNSASILTERYTPQLKLYASAVRQIFGTDKVKCCIYSFTLGELIDVDTEQ